MARLAPARKVALSMLSECRRRDARMRDLLRSSEAMAALSPRDRALAQRLCLGTTAAWGQLDLELNQYVKRPSSLEPRVRDALRLSCFEGCYLDTPESAVVSQGVELVRSVAPRAAGMANAVLRKAIGQGRLRVRDARERLEAGGAELADLALVSGLPAWLLARLLAARGEEAARDLALAQLEPAPVYLATNEARHGDSEVEGLLARAGLEPRQTGLPGSFCLDAPAGLANSGLVAKVDVVVADLAAQHVVQLAAPRPGERVLELGQGRGSKSILLESEALRHGGFVQIEGLDSEAFKVGLAARRMEAAGLAEQVHCHELDGRLLSGEDVPSALAGPFDLVFVDAPCSGTGTMRRHPEIPWSLSETAFSGPDGLPQLQLQLLCAAAGRVAAGGRLAYATCSVMPEENEQVIEAFLASEAGSRFRLVPQTQEVPYLQTMPRRGGCDGHFCAVLLG